jgi:cobalt/nickel transport system permease protein
MADSGWLITDHQVFINYQEEESTMHIPDQMLQGAICPITVAIGLAGVITAVVAAVRSKNKPGAARFAAVAALIFSGQMLNFPVAGCTSGHLLGGVLAVALLGAPFALLAMTLVLMVQALVFGDGGLLALGANVSNMALIGVGVGALFRSLGNRLPDMPLGLRSLLLGLAGWLAVMLAALAVCVELAVSGAVALATVAPAMLGVHAWIGIGEGLITALVFLLLAPRREATTAAGRRMAMTSAAAFGAALFLSPLASGLPDGLEMVAAALGILPGDGDGLIAPLAGYQVAGVGLATGLAGLAGVLLTFSCTWLLGCRMQDRTTRISS